jgi:predicted permease
MPTFLARLWRWFRRDRHAEELEEEMRLHMALRAEKLEREGMPGGDARDAAKRRFGNPTIHEERSHDMWGFSPLADLSQDLRFAWRRLRRKPALSGPTIAVLALGIGATTAVFSAVDAALLRPLPFVDAGRLMTLTSVSVPFQQSLGQSRLVDILDVRAMPEFSSATAFASGGLNFDDPDRPLRVNAGVVTADFFTTLGIRPAAGRGFTPEEGLPNGGNVVILSHAFWQRLGGGDMVGRSIPLQGEHWTIVGVMPAGFDFPKQSDVWIPMSVPTTARTFAPFRGWLPSRVVARLAPGVSAERAAAKLMARWEQSLVGADPRSSLKDWVNDVRQKGAVVPLQRNLVGERRRPLTILMGATLLLLLIACANVGNLLLSDAAARRREIAVRQALGASRLRVVRQLLIESVMLAGVGAALGLLLAPAALSLLRIMLPADLAGVAPAQLDLRVLAFATALSVGSGIAFGLWPARDASREDPGAVIKAGSGHGATARSGSRARRTLVTLELALTVMLLVGAGLMLRSFQRVMSQDMGLEPERAATLEMTFPRGGLRGTGDNTERLRVARGVLDQMRAEPGMEAVGMVNDLPLRGGGGLSLSIDIDGTQSATTSDDMQFARMLYATSGYFPAMGIHLLRGRLLAEADDAPNAPRVAVISATMASTYWPERDALGRTFRYPGDTIPISVVGIVADVREGRLDAAPEPQMYFPLLRRVPDNVALVARATLPPTTLLARMQSAVRGVAPGQAVYNVRMMEDVVSTSVAPRRTNTLLISLFAGIALVLAALGVYAVVAHGVAQRTREFGIRMALGATPGRLLMLVCREMGGVVILGLLIGLAGAWALSRVMASLLYEVTARDPLTFMAVPLVLVVPATVALLVPASRVKRLNPTQVMRAE